MREFRVNGSVTVICEYYRNSRNWGHRATVFVDGVKVKKVTITYYNRTWERFQYESVLRKALEKSGAIPLAEIRPYLDLAGLS